MSDKTRVLVLEDQMLVAFGLKAALESGGYEVVGPVASLEEAQGVPQANFDVAVLDINLGNDTNSTPYADDLTAAGIPFAFLSGYSSAAVLDDRFLGVERPLKPIGKDELIDAVEGLAAAR